MNIAQVITPWVAYNPPLSKTNHPKIVDDYAVTFSDVTEQPKENIPPSPNRYIVDIECDDATLALIKDDSEYEVLWSEEIINEE